MSEMFLAGLRFRFCVSRRYLHANRNCGRLWVANSQCDRIRLRRAVLHALAVVVPFPPCANSSSSSFTYWSRPQSFYTQVVYEPSLRSLFCSNISF